jgi:DUF4097 and DUF4098 domain-containing protein YvlB
LSGDIRGELIEGDGDLSSTSGNIRIGSVSGQKQKINLTSGNIAIDNFSGSGSINNTSGSMDIAITGMTGDLKLSNTSGGIDAEFAQNINAEISASCVSGDIAGNIDLNYGSKGKTAKANIGIAPYHTLTFETISGNIDINRKKP